MKTKISFSFFIASLVFLIVPSLVFADWTDPTAAPTGNNAEAPLNVGSDPQDKLGSLIVEGGIVTPTYGYVGIGQDPSCGCAPQDALDVYGNIVVSPSSAFGSPEGDITAAGNMSATAFYYTSDERLKENILPLQNSLSTIEKLQGVSFDWKKNQEPGIGFIAQDVQKVLPQVVSTDSSGYETVSYGNIVPLLVEAVKQQQQEIESLQKEVEDLKSK